MIAYGYEEITATYCIYRQVTPNILKPQNCMLLQQIPDEPQLQTTPIKTNYLASSFFQIL